MAKNKTTETEVNGQVHIVVIGGIDSIGVFRLYNRNGNGSGCRSSGGSFLDTSLFGFDAALSLGELRQEEEGEQEARQPNGLFHFITFKM